MNYVKMFVRIGVSWGMLYLFGAFLCAEWNSYFWHDMVRFTLVMFAALAAFAFYGSRNLED